MDLQQPEYKDQWGDLDIAGTIAKVTAQTVEGLVENTLKRAGLQRLIDGATPRNDETALDSRGWQESMFSERASHLLETAAMRLRKAGKSDGFAVFNAAQDHILAAAKAETGRPSLIKLRTVIGWPSPGKQNTGGIHGSKLGEDEVRELEEALRRLNPWLDEDGLRRAVAAGARQRHGGLRVIGSGRTRPTLPHPGRARQGPPSAG